jgi:hypothetical protein
MIHIMLPAQYLGRTGHRFAEPHKRLMAAVLQTVVDDCRGGSAHRRASGRSAVDQGAVRKAVAYVASTDRAWPFSFENLCDALDIDAGSLRQELDVGAVPGRADHPADAARFGFAAALPSRATSSNDHAGRRTYDDAPRGAAPSP